MAQLVLLRLLHNFFSVIADVEEQRLADVLPSYDVFIQHSLRKEGSPVSIAEAMACGLPVIATPVGGINEQVVEGKTGLLVAEGDVDGMAAAMKKLAFNPQLGQNLGRAGRERGCGCGCECADTACRARSRERWNRQRFVPGPSDRGTPPAG